MTAIHPTRYERAVSSLGWPEASLDDVIALAQRHGLKSVELRTLGGTVDLPRHLTATVGTPEALAAKLRDCPVRIAAFGTSLRILDGSVEDREKFLEFIPWAEALGVPRLRVFDGGKKVDDAELARAAEMASWWRDLRAKRGWRTDIVVETHDSLVTTPAIRRFLSAVPGMPILWDTHHTWKKGGENPVDTWRTIRPHVVHIHVKDSMSVPSEKHPFTYVLPGAGEFPMATLKAELTTQYSGIVCLEWEKMWHPYLPPLDQALAVAGEKNWW